MFKEMQSKAGQTGSKRKNHKGWKPATFNQQEKRGHKEQTGTDTVDNCRIGQCLWQGCCWLNDFSRQIAALLYLGWACHYFLQPARHSNTQITKDERKFAGLTLDNFDLAVFGTINEIGCVFYFPRIDHIMIGTHRC